MFALHDVKVIALALTFSAACSTPDLDLPDVDAGSPGQGGSYAPYMPPVCDQECQDYGVGLALVDTVWLLYNQNIAHRPLPAGGFDNTVSCPLGGNAHITGTLSVSDGATSVQLTYDLSACANSDSFYDLTFDGSVVQSGSFDGEGFTAVTFTGADLEISGTVMWLDDPSVDETCDVSATQEEHADEGTLDGRVCGRNFSSVTAFDHVSGGAGSTGGGGGTTGSGGSGGRSTGGGGSGGVVSVPGSGCPSLYDGTYIGQFAYDYETPGPMPMTGTGSFNLTLTFQCTAVAGGQALLMVTRANASDAYFGCGVGGCTPEAGSVAVMPADPPTTPSSPSRSGMGLIVNFPNGTVLGTSNQGGELNVTSGGTMLSNSVSSGTMTWSAVSLSSITAFPGNGNRITSFKSWSMSKSGL